ncbi:hypothetical protein DRQ36_10195, partial [bacterium]
MEMIPLELTLENFRSYRGPETVNFSGLRRVCIIGQNGSGKSTLIAAMLWALFGKSNLNTSELIRTGAKSTRVELLFSAEQDKYRVIRIAKRRKSSASTQASLARLTDHGEEPLEDGVKSVNTTIERILGMDYYGFTSASILLQGNADRFSSMAPAERKEFLAEILGLSLCDE